jgi:hypothetical protein
MVTVRLADMIVARNMTSTPSDGGRADRLTDIVGQLDSCVLATAEIGERHPMHGLTVGIASRKPRNAKMRCSKERAD